MNDTTYATCCGRDNFTLHKTDMAFNQGLYDYTTNPLNVLRPNSVCLGPGAGLGLTCSNYGDTRSTIGGKPGNAIMHHRAIISSGCPANMITSEPEIWDQTVALTPDQQLVLNRGVGVTSYSTRSFAVNSQLTDMPILADYRFKPNRNSEGYQGYLPFQGVNTPTRQVSTCEVSSRFRMLKNSGPSLTSFGSYGVVGAI
jgi:hypothetical protein